ncbi:ADP-ribosyl cyclase/cyclic ADP-ribose hydrolase 1 [Triplophysa rosa]|uniref:ADP-ribosyl cyclase/cyclic ADP-ribose hydrolase 1 n=1 Tax=Triplophysa rosa TaxID=992332 RepID=UPI002546253B|nr:ADP-ribosyl cyclase/cyclic ADP-ribose hydrolase 1 [Triplophysa rosa]
MRGVPHPHRQGRIEIGVFALFSGNYCEDIWSAFVQAYVGKDPCSVPPEAYNPLVNSVQQKIPCNKNLFWSRTKDMAHAFTKNRDCLMTLEDTLMGFMFDGLKWCSSNGSKETFTTGCPGWTECANNPVRSFWSRASDNVSRCLLACILNK